MMQRVRGLFVVSIVLVAGAFIGSAISQWRPLPEADPNPTQLRDPVESSGRPERRIRVEVLNAGGEAGMARLATEELRARGFDVVYFGNADRFDQDSTVVIDRVGGLESARAVADVLGGEVVISEPDSNLYLDVTVRLGASWFRDRAESEPEEAPGRWWDVRRMFR